MRLYVLVASVVGVCWLVAGAEAQVFTDVVSVIHSATGSKRGR